MEAAKENGILDKEQVNAETSISGLMTFLGYDEVRFIRALTDDVARYNDL